jgi:hypothetical protein
LFPQLPDKDVFITIPQGCHFFGEIVDMSTDNLMLVIGEKLAPK